MPNKDFQNGFILGLASKGLAKTEDPNKINSNINFSIYDYGTLNISAVVGVEDLPTATIIDTIHE